MKWTYLFIATLMAVFIIAACARPTETPAGGNARRDTRANSGSYPCSPTDTRPNSGAHPRTHPRAGTCPDPRRYPGPHTCPYPNAHP